MAAALRYEGHGVSHSHNENCCVPIGSVPYRLYNIGNHTPVDLLDFIQILENHLGKKAKKEFLPMQMGYVRGIYADVTDLMTDLGFSPSIPLSTGLKYFISWYRISFCF